MKYHLQIVGPALPGHSPSVLVHFDDQRYLFNCPEGQQRIGYEHKIRLKKLKSIFLTRVAWECVGGLPGMILTLADSGSKNIAIHGPENLTHFLAGTRHFIYRSAISVETHEFHRVGSEYKDRNLVVSPVYACPSDDLESLCPIADPVAVEPKALRRNRSASPLRVDTALGQDQDVNLTIAAGSSESVTITPVDVALPPVWDSERMGAERLPRVARSHVAITYICQGPEKPRKFNPAAARKLGVQPGPDFGRLTKGESVQTATGTTVTPDQVMIGDPKPGAVFCIVDCPSKRYINSLLASAAWSAYGAEGPKKMHLMVHIIGDDVLDDERYQAWMRSFGSETEHIILNKQYNEARVPCCASGVIQYSLNQIDSQIFPLPHHCTTAELDLGSVPTLPAKTRAGYLLQSYQFEPDARYLSDIVPVDYLEQAKKAPLSQSVAESIECLRAKVDEAQQARQNSDDSAEASPERKPLTVTTLGTGSAIPGKYRNVSSTLVKMCDGKYILLDGGEGTLGQLFRSLGPSRLQSMLRSLRCIFVSHLHADHHLGIINILRAWKEDRATYETFDTPFLYIIAPQQFFVWLKEYSDCEDFGLEDTRFITSESIRWGCKKRERPPNETIVPSLMAAMSLKSINTVGVHHCPSAYAITLEHQSGDKIVFSGDCRPSADLAEAGQNATVVIHEATFEDDKREEAVARKHCTTTEAIEVAIEMNAERLLLTHFSQRYPKVPYIPLSIVPKDHRLEIGVGFDLMRVQSANFWKLPLMSDAINLLFREMVEEDEPEI
ncbi:beta-lactamase-like protein [Polychytrium aggregatum]|uniref:beta-lactamase-like protein n=1 Tax=Polychytrium aggregatum TaxID=110093 RepID=UPI0022FEB3C3|nr:beta-lactamase-like protein [Polychytrium aggregatum]KAI9208712.1 beta-lactamase-like protein [Polychytrium aggregatum]